MSYKIPLAGGPGNLGFMLIPLEADSLIDQELTVMNNSLYGNIR